MSYRFLTGGVYVFSSYCPAFALNTLTFAILTASGSVCADDYFNLNALETGTPLENTGALEAYLRHNGLSPGRYLTSIVWDQDRIDKRNLNYLLSKDNSKLIPQFTKAELRELGVKVDTVPALNNINEDTLLGDISEYIADARYDFSPETQVLQLRIPQIYRDKQISGESNPASGTMAFRRCGPATMFRVRISSRMGTTIPLTGPVSIRV